MNWLVFGIGIAYIGGAVWQFLAGGRILAAVYVMYGICSMLLSRLNA